jgi:hypothetical protein
MVVAPGPRLSEADDYDNNDADDGHDHNNEDELVEIE